MLLLLALIAPADAGRFTFDDDTSSIAFDMAATLHKFHGTAKTFSGELNIEDEITGKLSIVASSLDTGLGLRDKRMRGYCLEPTRWPTIDLKVAAVTGDLEGLRSGEGSGPIELVGQMTIRSTPREVDIPVTYAWTDGSLKLTGSYRMQWTDYGVPDPSIPISKLLPDMTVLIDVTASERP